MTMNVAMSGQLGHINPSQFDAQNWLNPPPPTRHSAVQCSPLYRAPAALLCGERWCRDGRGRHGTQLLDHPAPLLVRRLVPHALEGRQRVRALQVALRLPRVPRAERRVRVTGQTSRAVTLLDICHNRSASSDSSAT